MQKLKYTFKTDILFKLLFTKHQHLLKKLVANLLRIPLESITQFGLKSTEATPDILGSKFCVLDIHMIVNKQHVNLEVQVENEGNFTERVMFHWARIYSNALKSGGDYIDLPQVIIVSIVDFKLFNDCKEFHSEFQVLEVTRNIPLTYKQIYHFFELPKLPVKMNKDDLLLTWLALFNANTEEDLKMIENLGVTEINEAITAYRSASVSDELQEIERMRENARLREALVVKNVKKRVEKAERERWKSVVADKDAALADKDATLADKELEIEQLRKKLTELQDKSE